MTKERAIQVQIWLLTNVSNLWRVSVEPSKSGRIVLVGVSDATIGLQHQDDRLGFNVAPGEGSPRRARLNLQARPLDVCFVPVSMMIPGNVLWVYEGLGGKLLPVMRPASDLSERDTINVIP
jgi:hypothetical protein